MDTGRWTIVSRATSQPRRPSSPTHMRARVNVRCVCGAERAVWLEDIETGRSSGCESRRCHARFQAVCDVRTMLNAWVERDRLALLRVAADARSQPQRRALERLAEESARDRLAGLEHVIVDWLRAPLHVELSYLELELDAVVGHG